MATEARPGIGARLYRWNTIGTSGAWELIDEVTALSWDGISRNIIEVFKLNNSTDYVDKIQGVLNAGNISATVMFTKNGFDKLRDDAETRGNRDYQIRLPGGEGIEFEGFVAELPLDIGSDDVMQSEVSFAVSGKPDFLSSATT